MCLWAAAEAKGYESGEWATYQQWQERGAQVRKGEKSTTVVFWKFANDARESRTTETNSLRAVRGCCSRADIPCSMPPRWTATRPKAEPEATMPERIDHAEAFFQRIGADLRHGGNQAYYSPVSDHIQMPPFAAFVENVSYYSTLAHEHTHWTATADRCDRQLGKRFGDSAYAAEELIAELGAAFTCAHLGLSTEPREDHAQYIQSWLKVLKADKRAIFTAASQSATGSGLADRAGGVRASVAEVAA